MSKLETQALPSTRAYAPANSKAPKPHETRTLPERLGGGCVLGIGSCLGGLNPKVPAQGALIATPPSIIDILGPSSTVKELGFGPSDGSRGPGEACTPDTSSTAEQNHG